MTNIRVDQGGEYTATYTNDQGCKSTQKFKLTVNPVVSANIPEGKAGFSVSINNNILRTTGNAGINLMVSLYTLKGELVFRKNLTGQAVLPLASELIGGSYLLEVKKAGRVVLKNRVLLAD